MDPVSGLRLVNTVTSDMVNIVKTAKAHERSSTLHVLLDAFPCSYAASLSLQHFAYRFDFSLYT